MQNFSSVFHKLKRKTALYGFNQQKPGEKQHKTAITKKKSINEEATRSNETKITISKTVCVRDNESLLHTFLRGRSSLSESLKYNLVERNEQQKKEAAKEEKNSHQI
jgi:hypothetical protein